MCLIDEALNGWQIWMNYLCQFFLHTIDWLMRGKVWYLNFRFFFGIKDSLELNNLCMGKYNNTFSVGAFI